MSDGIDWNRPVSKTKLFSQLPPEWPEDLFPALQSALRRAKTKVVVLDDDPTGTQTIHGVHVLTTWDVDILRNELANERPAVFLLTNSRSLPPAEARALNTHIGRNLAEAASLTGQKFVVISRSDSTLRGHFPAEVEALEAALGGEFDAWLLIPAFLGGGRYTINDVQFVAEGNQLLPAAQTEFAEDSIFGYRSSNLRDWVAEKSAGRIPAKEVVSISIEEIRVGGPDKVARRLIGFSDRQVCVVNIGSSADLGVFTYGLLEAETAGKRFLYRTAASIVPVRAGIPPRALLKADELDMAGSTGALYIVGSHVPKTTGQLERLLKDTDVQGIECSVQALADKNQRISEIERVTNIVDRHLSAGEDAAVYTSRTVVVGAGDMERFAIGQRVAQGLVEIVRCLSTRPRYILAKGGITSSDVATSGLDVKKALVLGQISSGVSIWQLGRESRYPGLLYIVFPGNVGGPDALVRVWKGLAPGVGRQRAG